MTIKTASIIEVIEGLDLITRHPLIGQPLDGDLHALAIGPSNKGRLALYKYAAEPEKAFVLAVRNQRQAGCLRQDTLQLTAPFGDFYAMYFIAACAHID